MAVFNNIIAGSSGQSTGGYQVSRSLRFSSGDSSYLSRTPASAGNRRTWTFSCWIKRAKLDEFVSIIVCMDASASHYFQFVFNTNNQLEVYDTVVGGGTIALQTTQVFRDTSAWYHLVLYYNTTQSTAANKAKLYVNGSEVTTFSVDNRASLTADSSMNRADQHSIGSRLPYSGSYLNAYLADIHFIDGQALTPTSFGEFDATTGVWNPKTFVPQATPNNGTVWSSYGSLSPSPPILSGTIADIFDGSIVQAGGSFSINQANAGVTVSFSPPLPAGTTVKLLGEVYGTAGSNNSLQVNGTGYAQSLPASPGTSTFAALNVPAGNSGISSIYIYREGVSTFNYVLMGIEVDGVLLIDGNTSNIGLNGFHLEFADNSAATATTLGKDTSGNGNNWTPNNFSVTEGTGNYIAGQFSGNVRALTDAYGPRAMFNGITGGESLSGGPCFAPYSSNSTCTWTPTTAFTGLTSLRIYAVLSGTFGKLTVNGVDYSSLVTALGSGGHGYITIPQNSLSSISFGYTNGLNDATGVAAVEVNGTVLLDNSVVGPNNDSLVDVPTDGAQTDTGVGGEVRGNYATLNPLQNTSNTLSDGNLSVSVSGSGWTGTTIAMTTGKWYTEFTVGTGVIQMFGVCNVDFYGTGNNAPWTTAGAKEVTYYVSDGRVYVDGVNTGTTFGATAGDVISIAFDADARSVAIRKNNTLLTTKTITANSAGYTFYVSSGGGACTATLNFGQRAFAYTAPNGYKALCTTNLPEPTILKGNTAMDVALYTGTNATLNISGLFSVDFVWIKSRSAGTEHLLYDTVRDVRKYLKSNSTGPETTATAGYGLTSFNTDGFTLGLNNDGENASGATYAAWCWDAGSSTVTNTAGSITSSVRANATAGFSIVTFTGSSGSQTIGHGLGVAPQLIILKYRNGASGWYTYHGAIAAGNNKLLKLNSTDAQDSSANYWNSTAPTSTVFTLGSDLNTTNTWVAYCFAPVSGYSAMGSYVGNGSADGPFIYTGFRPRWVMIKATSITGQTWQIQDTARDPYNYAQSTLFANTSGAEQTAYSPRYIDYLSNGFKSRGNDDGNNQSGATYVWAAFAESPFQYARAR